MGRLLSNTAELCKYTVVKLGEAGFVFNESAMSITRAGVRVPISLVFDLLTGFSPVICFTLIDGLQTQADVDQMICNAGSMQSILERVAN